MQVSEISANQVSADSKKNISLLKTIQNLKLVD